MFHFLVFEFDAALQDGYISIQLQLIVQQLLLFHVVLLLNLF